jgi:hypothetical protein
MFTSAGVPEEVRPSIFMNFSVERRGFFDHWICGRRRRTMFIGAAHLTAGIDEE